MTEQNSLLAYISCLNKNAASIIDVDVKSWDHRLDEINEKIRLARLKQANIRHKCRGVAMNRGINIHFYRCRITKRLWININQGWFAIGFGPKYLLERVWVKRKPFMFNNKRYKKYEK